MIGKLLNAFFKVVIGLINVLLLPIDTLISSLLPSLDNLLTYVANLFDYVNGVIGYCVDASGLTDIAIGFIVSYWVFVIGSTSAIAVTKLAMAWYEKFKF